MHSKGKTDVIRVTHEPHKEFLLATAITSVVALAGLFLPVVGALVCVFVPLPVLFYRSKLGRHQGALIVVAVTVIVAFSMGWRSVTAVAFFFELGLAGFVLSESFEMDFSLEKTVAVTTGVVVGTGAIMLALYNLFTPNSLWEQVSQYLHNNLQLALDVYRDLEVSPEQIDLLASSMEGILYVVLRIMPAIVVVSTLLVVWSNLLLARPLLRNRRLFCPDFGVLNEWKAPEALVWIAIVSGLLLLIPVKGLRLLGVNGLIVMAMVYFFQGIAIVSYYFEKKRFPRPLRGILYGLIALQQFILLLVIAAGFFDLWIDFRRIKKRSETNHEGNTERND